MNISSHVYRYKPCIILSLRFLSDYFFYQETFGARVKSILRPPAADVAACRGAALYGRYASNDSPLISSIISPKSYIVAVGLPAESEDLAKHAELISTNSQNMEMCMNRCVLNCVPYSDCVRFLRIFS